jgi:membrane protease YdiL (CAAX protease family)
MQNNATLPALFIGLFAMGFIFCFFAGWVVVISLFFSKKIQKKWLQPKPRKSQCYGLIDIVMAIFIVLGAQIATRILAVLTGLVKPGGGTGSLTLTSLGMLMSIFAVGMTTAIICITRRVSPSRVGWSLSRVGLDFLLAVSVFVLCIPFVYGLMAGATLFLEKEYEHPLFEMVQSQPSLLFLAFFTAVIGAPIIEEFGFRVIIQGALEGIGMRPLSLQSIMFGNSSPADPSNANPESISGDSVAGDNIVVTPDQNESPRVSEEATSGENEFATASSAAIPLAQTLNPYDPQGQRLEPAPSVEGEQSNQATLANTTSTSKVPIWPIFVSGTLFGLAHFEYGVSWIPLCVLGYLLGFLYRYTNRIWPCIFVHMIFNGIAMTIFSLQVLYPEAFPAN